MPTGWRQQGIILAILALLTGTSCALSEGDVFILPEGYRGVVFVVFDQPDGQAEMRQGSNRLFKIPASGVLKMKDPSRRGWSIPDKYYFEEKTDRNSIRYEHNLPANDKREVIVSGYSDGKIFLNGDTIEFLQFFVGNSDEIQLASDSMDHSLGLINVLDPADTK
ncbi:MAG: hypothetical protein ABI599_15625 [Flavobacteriales bacterium]